MDPLDLPQRGQPTSVSWPNQEMDLSLYAESERTLKATGLNKTIMYLMRMREGLSQGDQEPETLNLPVPVFSVID